MYVFMVYFLSLPVTSGQSLLSFRAHSIFCLEEGRSFRSSLQRGIKVSANFHAKIKFCTNPVC